MIGARLVHIVVALVFNPCQLTFWPTHLQISKSEYRTVYDYWVPDVSRLGRKMGAAWWHIFCIVIEDMLPKLVNYTSLWH